MADVYYSTESYCALCDLYFPTIEKRAEHVLDAPNHPFCEPCSRHYLNGNVLRNHFIYSRYHHYCAECRINFKSAKALKRHIEYSSVHGDYSDEDDSEEEYDESEGSDSESVIVGSEYSDDDDSWEHFDEFDFEDEEDLGDNVPDYFGFDQPSEEECDQNEDGVPIDKFTCPICKQSPQTVCSTSCGHLFCGPCIRMAYCIQGTCPVCDEAGSVKQIRKLYLSV